MRDKILAICKEINGEINWSCTHLVDDALIDSVTLVEIATGIMDAFDVDIPYEEIVPVNFNSIDAMTQLVKKYV